MVWIDFGICLVFGVFGVHKFREKKIGMGIIYLFTCGLFCIGWFIDCIIYLLAAIKGESVIGKAKNLSPELLESDSLPIVQAGNILLTSGETCHYSGQATIQKIKNKVVGYSGGSSGVSIRIMKGMSYRVGAIKGKAIREDVAETFTGILTVTNKRIIFSASNGSFDKKIQNLSSIIPYKDAIEFQFGTQNYQLLTIYGIYIYQIIARTVNNTDLEA